MLGGRFGASSAEIVIEEFLEGEEASLFALCDGTTALFFGTAQDHKRAFDGDRRAEHGRHGRLLARGRSRRRHGRDGHGANRQADARGARARGTPFRGFLYAGLMITREGPKLIEYNCRFGDPECQVVMPRLMTDLVTAMLAARDGMLGKFTVRFSPRKCVGVVLASQGYPGEFARGSVIDGIEAASASRGSDGLPGRHEARRRAPSRRWRARADDRRRGRELSQRRIGALTRASPRSIGRAAFTVATSAPARSRGERSLLPRSSRGEGARPLRPVPQSSTNGNGPGKRST